MLANHLSGIYLYSGKAITRVAGQGDPIDRKPRFTYVSALTNGGAGRVLFSASTFPGGDGVFDEDRNPIARQADPAPEGGVFTSVSLPGVNDRAEMAFVAGNSRGPNDLYLLSGGILNRILSTGDPAPGGGTFFDFYNPSLNNKGEIAFVGVVFPSYNWGLYVGSGVFRRLVSSGDPAPGGGTFTSFGHSVSLNDSGQILFSALVATPGRSGIFLWSAGSVQSVAQQGDAAPGGGSFLSVLQPSMNASGQVAFGARGVPVLRGCAEQHRAIGRSGAGRRHHCWRVLSFTERRRASRASGDRGQPRRYLPVLRRSAKHHRWRTGPRAGRRRLRVCQFPSARCAVPGRVRGGRLWHHRRLPRDAAVIRQQRHRRHPVRIRLHRRHRRHQGKGSRRSAVWTLTSVQSMICRHRRISGACLRRESRLAARSMAPPPCRASRRARIRRTSRAPRGTASFHTA